MKELMCQVQMYFAVPEGMTPEEYKNYLVSLTMLDMVRQFNEAYATDWQWADEEGTNWKPV